jgi:hypothetical protein
MYIPLAIASMGLPKSAGMRPLNSIPLIAEVSFIFAVIDSIMSTSNPTALSLSVGSNGGKGRG